MDTECTTPNAKPDYGRVKREVATLLEQFSFVEPPVDPVKIAREKGVTIVFADFSPEQNNISGFYDPKENSIFVNRAESPLRQTFTIAHELGHKILHEEWAKSNNYKMLMRNDTLENTDPKEKEANAFAAHLLVPRSMLDRYWKILTVEQLSKLFAVSVPVIKSRLSFEYGV